MTALAESLWNPDVPWEEMQQRYLEAAHGEHAGFAREYLETVEKLLGTGDPHRRTPPLSNSDQDSLAKGAARLGASLVEVKARYRATDDKVRHKSLDLLLHHIQFLQFIAQGYQARATASPLLVNLSRR